MRRVEVGYGPLQPWTPSRRRQVEAIAADLHPLDRAEIFGLRPPGAGPEDLVADIYNLIRSGRLLDGLIVYAVRTAPPRDSVPIAVVMAWRERIDRTAGLGLFGRPGYGRHMVELYRYLAANRDSFGARHNLTLARVPVLTRYTAARRWMRRTGGVEAFDYGEVGPSRQHYTEMIWRFGNGLSRSKGAHGDGTRPGDTIGG